MVQSSSFTTITQALPPPLEAAAHYESICKFSEYSADRHTAVEVGSWPQSVGGSVLFHFELQPTLIPPSTESYDCSKIDFFRLWSGAAGQRRNLGTHMVYRCDRVDSLYRLPHLPVLYHHHDRHSLPPVVFSETAKRIRLIFYCVNYLASTDQ